MKSNILQKDFRNYLGTIYKLLTIFLLIALNGRVAHAAYYVEGTITYNAFNNKGDTLATFIRHFSLESSGYASTIRVSSRLDGGGQEKYLYCENGLDGTNKYERFGYATNSSKPRSVTARITREPIPYPDSRLITPLWLAYGSSEKIKDGSQDFKPMWFTEESIWRNPRHSIPIRVQKSQYLPNLPEVILFFNRGQEEFVDQSGEFRSITNTALLRSGFTNAVYRAFDFTEVGANHVPKRFELTVYNFEESKQDPPYRLLQFTATAEIIKDLPDKVDFAPELPKNAVVLDYRNSSNGMASKPVAYSATNSWILDANSPTYKDAMLAAKHAAAVDKAVAQRERAAHDRKRGLVVSILATIAILPGVFWMWNHFKKPKQNTRYN
jgi:hypothetical protein